MQNNFYKQPGNPLAVLFPVRCANYNTVLPHQRSGAIAVINDRNPPIATLVRKCVIHEDSRQSFVESWRLHEL